MDDSLMPFDFSRLYNSKIGDVSHEIDQVKKGQMLSGEGVKKLEKALNEMSNQTILDKFIDKMTSFRPKIKQQKIQKKIDDFKSFIHSTSGKSALKAHEIIIKLPLMTTSKNPLSHSTEKTPLTKLETDLLNQKRSYFSNSVRKTSTNLNQLKEQSNRIPLITDAIKALSKNYEKWDLGVKDKKQNLSIKHQIETQHENIKLLSDFVQEIELNGDLNPIMKLQSGSQEISDLLRGVLSGDMALKTDHIVQLKEILNKEVTPFELAKLRKGSPISEDAIKAQSKVFEAERLGKAWAAEETQLKKHNSSYNNVFELMKAPNDDEVAPSQVGFYKEGSKNETATAVMETLMWDLAVILGKESLFTPTKHSEIKTGQENSLQSSKQLPIEGRSTKMKGSLQVAQKGRTLSDYIDKKNSTDKAVISESQLISGLLVSQVLGMFDAHADNIIIDDQGNIKFFDNTRCMPNGNGVILWGEMNLTPSTRCGLLFLDQTYLPFTPDGIKQLTTEITQYEEKIGKMEQFFNNKETNKRLELLPVGWWNKASVNAFKERIERIKTSLEKGEIKCLRDVVFASNPEVKFFGALHYIDLYKKISAKVPYDANRYQKIALSNVGGMWVSELLDSCIRNGIDPAHIKKLCEHPMFTFDSLQKEINKFFKEQNGLNSDSKAYLKNAIKINQDLMLNAVVDFKDVSRKSVKYDLYRITKERFYILGLELKTTLSGKLDKTWNLMKPGYYSLTEDTSAIPKIVFHYKDNLKAIRSVQVDYLANPGKLTFEIDGKKMILSHKEFGEILKDNTSPESQRNSSFFNL